MPKQATVFLGFMFARALILMLCAFAVTAAAKPMLRERVVSIQADQSILLSETGAAVVADMVFPDSALAQQWLTQHMLQQEIAFKNLGLDRYGRTLIAGDMQQAMLRDGAALLFVTGAVNPSLQQAEAAARAAKRGVWANPSLLLSAQNAADGVQQFHLVEGTITRVYASKSATYLNFGADWHTDFSVAITGRARRSFKAVLPQLKEGAHVRVRGLVIEENGPMIRLTRPEQLEIL